MPLYTSSYLKNLSKQKQVLLEKAFSESILTGKENYDIFLSHSYLDKEEVEGIYIELEDLGFKVYVDWIIDPNLDRNNVTKATAEIIRKRIKSSKSLLLAISANASTSKWIPWELGVMDGLNERCAILPVVKENTNQTSYKGAEFLSLYPFIKKLKADTGINKLWIIESAFNYIVFDDWLEKNFKPFKRDINIY